MPRRLDPVPERECGAPDCSVRFTPKRDDARFHSATCRQRAGRARKAAEAAAAPGPVDPDSGNAEHGLVRAVRKELTEADALETVDGQIALQLARRLADPDQVSSGLAKELRATIAAAKGSEVPVPTGEPAPAAAEDDEVRRAREAREQKARQAAARRA